MKTSDSTYNQCLYFVSNALARKVEKLANESWKKVDLSPSHAYLLMLVIDNPGMQPGALSEELHLSPSTITRLIEKLEDKKLVVRIMEGKTTNVYPSPKGKSLRPTLLECRDEFYTAYAKILGDKDSKTMVENMVKIADKLED
ncbi:MAG: MarR family winged helix-turn-helix transcriptional regulator [Chitinophagaceae bacterium]